jgi:hypothetical protein
MVLQRSRFIYIFHHKMWVKKIFNFKIWKQKKRTDQARPVQDISGIRFKIRKTDLKYKILWFLPQKYADAGLDGI